MSGEDYGVKFGDQQLLVEHPVGSGIFGAPCGITGLTRSIQTNTNDVSLPPCNDPYAVLWLGVDVVSQRMQMTFSGTLADNALPIWDAWSLRETRRKVRWYRNLKGHNRGYWEGTAVLTDYTEESSDRGRYTNSGTIIFDGQPTWRDIPPAPNNTAPVSINRAVAPVIGTAYTATPGVYAATPTFTRTYQWFREGVAIPGATNASYTPVAADLGLSLYVTETATNTGGSVSTSSLHTLPVVSAVTP